MDQTPPQILADLNAQLGTLQRKRPSIWMTHDELVAMSGRAIRRAISRVGMQRVVARINAFLSDVYGEKGSWVSADSLDRALSRETKPKRPRRPNPKQATMDFAASSSASQASTNTNPKLEAINHAP